MSIKLYFDAGGAQAILTAEKFVGAGPYVLTAFTGAQLGGVYRERKETHVNISFVNGVGSGFVGLVVDAFKGRRVIHNNMYVGQVTGNTDTTVTVSTAYTGASTSCLISSYTKLYTPTNFTLDGSSITMIDAVTAEDVIHAVPIDTLAMYFGGTPGSNVTKISQVYVKRTTDFSYSSLQVSSDDVSLFPYHVTTVDVVFTAGVGTGFSGLQVNALVGKALNHAGIFRGMVIANTESTVTIAEAYTAALATAEIYNVGSLEFSIDGVTYAPVITLPDMTGGTLSQLIYVKDTVSIPAAALNYPSNIVKISGIEYIA